MTVSDSEEEMNSADPSGISMQEQIRRFLESQGVNVDLALERAQTAEQSRKERARARVRAAGDIAFQLRRAKRRLDYLERGWLTRPELYSLAERNEAQERVTRLDAELREACLNDPGMIAEAKQRW